MAYAITKAGVRWFLDYYPMPVPLNLMALPVIAPKYIARSSTDCESTHWSPPMHTACSTAFSAEKPP